MVKKRNYLGYIPDEPDDRDYIFKLSTSEGEIPDTIDLRPYASGIENQGQLGSCCACASVAILEYLDNRTTGDYTNLSKLFAYYSVREDMGTTSYDSGASIRGILRAIANKGVCKESLWKYYIKNYKTKPPEECYQDALKHQILYYYRICALEDIRLSLSRGYPVICGIQVYESFEGEQAETTGYVPMPQTGERYLGGHAIAILGYDKDYFICRNSWGKAWGDGGYFYLTPEYFSKLGSDFWTISMIELPE